MTTLIENPEGATPLTPDDMLNLKHKHVNTREQLNELEAANILQGQMWASTLKKPTLDSLFDRDFVTNLHKALFGEVWEWAGTFRQRELNIGIEPRNISVDLHNFLEEKPMKWAYAKLEDVTEERSSYISGLRKADGSDFSEFIKYLQNLGN